MDRVPLGVRKGAWTEEEDCLLKKCIEKHGEGKWHQVPYKADNIQTRVPNLSKPSQTQPPGDDDGTLWWDNMLFDSEISRGMMTWTNDGSNEEVMMVGRGEKVKSGMQGAGGDHYSCVQEDQSDWSDIFMDNMDLWDILGDEQVVP
ncbi:hypothetical protein Vadar_010388 [Vaccinium darrowii]|uniref:Uncharacterized protein n=1 Tax=Vaccinium darrowii TaxID=229202 RepID=A0ACB7YDX0_9ERIC|nr:hypothetical protein Vadar_010388 [Vaccinium darrowii]